MPGLKLFDLLAEQFVIALEPVALLGLLNDQAHFFVFEGFGNEIVGPQLHGLDGQIDGAVGGHHDHAHLAEVFAGRAEKSHAVHFGHLDVAQHKIEGFFPQPGQCLFAVPGRFHGIARPLEHAGQHVAHVLLIVDNQYGSGRITGRHADGSSPVLSGRRNVTVVPCPGVLWAAMVPPIFSMMM